MMSECDLGVKEKAAACKGVGKKDNENKLT